ncbi:riboflavin synthase subunit alpha [Thermopolyspora flexuosa]|uniref:Riboflavin synthase n=1 Tax=Thermopolyspora flexuosa TaxID=103836 RepID=A0A543IZP9_9ACTN|nr:riboflavin synthase [Thermopolyspora flexuosa]TQM76050.1 riboflavin synthase alpha chain [Thermopolyspora flexuosa]GGM64292.1 riboflavin synthase subunit alpha [Thermopolyspora flexuosa]
MFTGIVEEIGEIVRVEPAGDGARLEIRGKTVTEGTRHGDSIAVDGVCLTVVGLDGEVFTVDVVAETLARSTLGGKDAGARVNLERAVRADQRLGGHIVQGHVDGTAAVLDRTPGDHGERMRFSLPPALARYVVEKGSIAVDGVSLTVAAVDAESFTVALIPATLELTTLGARRPGDPVNLEVDVIAKYVEKQVAAYAGAHAREAGR